MSLSFKYLILLSLFTIILSQPQICYDYCAPNGCNCYKVFGVKNNAPPNEIKQRHRALSLQYHPDKNLGKDSDAKFAEIASCYDILKDTRSRAHYDDCMRYDYAPNSNNDILWGLVVPIISVLVNVFRRKGPEGAQAGQAGGSMWKKILKGFGYVILIIVVFLVLLFKAPFVLEYILAAFKYVDDEIFGGNTFYVVLAGIWGFKLIKKAFGKFRSSVNEDEIKKLLPELRKALDANQERIDKEISDKRKTKEDEINLEKEKELEIFQRSHDKPEGNGEDRALLESQKEAEVGKTFDQNVQLCETRYNEKLRNMQEQFNELIEGHKTNFESFRDLVSNIEKDVEAKLKEKKTSNEKLKEELQAVAKLLADQQIDFSGI